LTSITLATLLKIMDRDIAARPDGASLAAALKGANLTART
jgi:hypothetical protein